MNQHPHTFKPPELKKALCFVFKQDGRTLSKSIAQVSLGAATYEAALARAVKWLRALADKICSPLESGWVGAWSDLLGQFISGDPLIELMQYCLVSKEWRSASRTLISAAIPPLTADSQRLLHMTSQDFGTRGATALKQGRDALVFNCITLAQSLIRRIFGGWGWGLWKLMARFDSIDDRQAVLKIATVIPNANQFLTGKARGTLREVLISICVAIEGILHDAKVMCPEIGTSQVNDDIGQK